MTDKRVYPEAEFSEFRSLDGWLGRFVKWTLTAIPLVGCFFIMDIPFYLRWTILNEQYKGLILAMVLSCTFIIAPASRKSQRNRVPWYDLVLAILGIVVGLYIAIFYREIVENMGNITQDRVIVGTIAFVLIFEASRRVTNWSLALLGLIFFLFPRFSLMITGIFYGKFFPYDRQINYLFLDTNGILGIILEVAVFTVLGYVLFGNLLINLGGGEFITDLSMAAFGRFRGGPAKMAVIASSLFGTISGVAVANVATTGIVTIPLMKRVGYKPHIAGAIEAVASTGGQIMPPIMGVAAFIMAEYLGVPYQKVAIAAIIPALLYYISLFFQVDMEAGKLGLKGLPKEHLPKLSSAIGKSHLFIIPFSALLVSLFVLYMPPEKSAIVGVLSILLLGFFIQKETLFRIEWISKALHYTGQALLQLIIICTLAGIVVGTISYTGIGFMISLYLDEFAGGNLFVLLFIVAVVSLILGMGMPTVSVYVVLAVLIAPAMIRLGIEPMAAHMFLLYFGGISLITPPVCPAAYAGAAIANASPMRTGFAATRLGIVAYIVPFLFIFSPGLLLRGAFGEIVFSVTTSIGGCFGISVALSGYLFQELNLIKRIIMGFAAICLIIPTQSHFQILGFLFKLMGGGMTLLIILGEWRIKSAKRIDYIK